MQTSSNFFNKNLLTLQDESFKRKKKDKYHESHIVPDPLRLKDQLTPWTQINPKYNFNTERLVKFKQKNYQESQLNAIEEDSELKYQPRQELVSNLFNFYKNNKETKKSTLSNAKRKGKQKDSQQDSSWTLPPIHDQGQVQENNAKNNESIENQNSQNKINNDAKNNKSKQTFIQSISIREYLKKLKEKQKVFSTPIDSQKRKNQNQQKDLYISKRFMKSKSKEKLSNSINLVREARKAEMNFRYAPIRNPQNNTSKKKSMSSHFQSLQQLFQLYKKAAEKQVQETSSTRRKPDQSQKQINFILAQKSLFKNNVPLSQLFSSINIGPIESSIIKHQSLSPLKKFNTISYDSPFPVNSQRSSLLPKVNKNFSYKK